MGIQGLTSFFQARQSQIFLEIDLTAEAKEQPLTLTVDGLSLCHYLRQNLWVRPDGRFNSEQQDEEKESTRYFDFQGFKRVTQSFLQHFRASNIILCVVFDGVFEVKIVAIFPF